MKIQEQWVQGLFDLRDPKGIGHSILNPLIAYGPNGLHISLGFEFISLWSIKENLLWYLLSLLEQLYKIAVIGKISFSVPHTTRTAGDLGLRNRVSGWKSLKTSRTGSSFWMDSVRFLVKKSPGFTHQIRGISQGTGSDLKTGLGEGLVLLT